MSSVLAIDAGTTGVTAIVVSSACLVSGRGYREFPQHFPRAGLVEHDPEEIWQATLASIGDALASADIEASDLCAIGITNQRETAVLWERSSLRAMAPAIVWQDRRTAQRCDEMRDHEPMIRSKTGLVLDSYFSATKIEWLLQSDSSLRDAAMSNRVAFGTIDSWILAKLTGNQTHATDVSNASRTLVYDIYRQSWDDELLDLFSIPKHILPEVKDSSGRFGVTDPNAFFGASIPVSGIAGDQQAALFGQACFRPGMTKNTYGTGSFVLMNTGPIAPAPPKGLLVTVAWSLQGTVTYALEGAIFVTGAALQWLRDGLGIIEHAAQTQPLCETVPDSDGVFFVPALTGLGSPYWDPYARGTILGITRGTTRAHLVRAAVEAMAYQTRDVIEAMSANAGLTLEELRVDGGASVMSLLCQLQADQLGVIVRRPAISETTALGAAFLAGLAEGVWSSTDEITTAWKLDAEYAPGPTRTQDYERWKRAVAAARSWPESADRTE